MSLLPPLHDALLGLGANEGDPPAALASACEAIADWPRCRLLAAGEPVWTEPWGEADQPRFLNQVIRIETAQPALALMDLVAMEEHRMGRRRDQERRHGPRLIDIDLLAFDRLVVRSPRLTLPHPGLLTRPYLLELVAALLPAFRVPGDGRTPAEVLATLR